jgi:orotate phosphoribosyltransferase
MNFEEEEYKCIKFLENSMYIEKWKTLRGIYRKKLDQGPVSSEIKFTTHNYSTHCVNIYKIISEVIVDFSKIESQRTIFLLDVAVLLHDIIMADDTNKRETHSKDGKAYILEQVNSHTNNSINNILDNSEAKIVADAILGHGNITLKDDQKINTLEELHKQCIKRPTDDNKLACQIAAALRLADELDTTTSRIVRPLEDYHFDDKNKNDILSKKHHKKLELIESIFINPSKNDQLLIGTNDFYFEKNDFKDDDGELLLEVKDKITKELESINDYITSKLDYCFYRSFHSVDIDTNNTELMLYLKDPKKKSKKVLISDQEISKYLEDYIKSKKLLRTGNYKINSKVCTHEWIDIVELLENEDVVKRIVSKFFEISKEIIEQYGTERVIIIGAGLEGLKIGALLAYSLGCLYTYYIPGYMEKSQHDISIECKNKKIVIVTDAIATGETTEDIISECKIEQKNIIKILSVFGREVNKNRETWKYEEITVYLNTSFRLDIISQEDCQIKQTYGKCVCIDI